MRSSRTLWFAALAVAALAVISSGFLAQRVDAQGTPGGGLVTRGIFTIFQNTASAATLTGTAEQTLFTYTLPANTLQVGTRLRIRAGFATAANTNSKTPKLYFGASALATAAVTTSAAGAVIELVVVKNGASTQLVSGWGIGGATGVIPVTLGTTGTDTDTAGIVIKATCTDGTSSAGDCLGYDFNVTIEDF